MIVRFKYDKTMIIYIYHLECFLIFLLSVSLVLLILFNKSWEVYEALTFNYWLFLIEFFLLFILSSCSF